jgi:alkanesulfonate monooxygenase SsuD/methylene tetrahydromethanopterin reductase-like flavin-dependent oxidoreductase (luciferase family)
MEFGVAIGANTGIPGFAREAEDRGFDVLGCGEHMMFHRPVLNSLIALSAAVGPPAGSSS